MAKIQSAKIPIKVTSAGVPRLRFSYPQQKLAEEGIKKRPDYAVFRGEKLKLRPSDWRIEIPERIRQELSPGDMANIVYVVLPEEWEGIDIDANTGHMIYRDEEENNYVMVRQPELEEPEEVMREDSLEVVLTLSIETDGGNEMFEAEMYGSRVIGGLSQTEIESLVNEMQNTIKDYIFNNFDASKKRGKMLSDLIEPQNTRSIIKEGLETKTTRSNPSSVLNITIEKSKARRASFSYNVSM